MLHKYDIITTNSVGEAMRIIAGEAKGRKLYAPGGEEDVYKRQSVAMENGEKSVRRAARFIAPHHAEGGVGKFLFEKVLL